MIKERKEFYHIHKNDKEKLRNHKYRTEKQYKSLYPFLKEADSNSLQQARRHLQDAYNKFFRNIKDRKNKRTKRYVGYPKYKSRHNRQAYTTCITNNNIKIDWNKRSLKLPKLKQWVRFKDDRTVDAEIKKVTISKSKAGQYFASILFKKSIQTKKSKKIISEDKIVAFDMSAKDFLVSESFRFSNPRFYRNNLNILKKKHRTLSRKKLGSKNRVKAKLVLANQYDKIRNQKNDWTHKITCTMSKTYDAIILEDLNIDGMKRFNKGLAKSVSLDFSWNQFKMYLEYKCKRERNHLVTVGRYFASSQLSSNCGYKNEELELNDREWVCPECKVHHDRDGNASRNLKKEGIRILREKNITIINSFNDNTIGTMEIHAFGDRVRPYSVKAVIDELGIHSH
jgi:putative transposase